MNRLSDMWSSARAVALRRLAGRLVVFAARGAGRLLAELLWDLRLVWIRISPRARILLIVLTLALLARATATIAPSISATLQGLAVLLFAAVGLWLILSSPFRERRWWGSQ